MKEFVEEDIIILPNIVDGPAWIGDLWNCQDSSSHVGSNLFSSFGQLDVHTLGDYEYDLTHIKSTKDRIKSLNVEGSLSLELLSGLIKVEGGAKYDFKDESNSLEEELICRYSLRTFRVDANSNAIINEHILAKILRGEIKTTHVVKQVQLGAHISANLRIRDRSSKVNTTADGNLAGKLVYGPVSASVKVKLGFLDSDEGKDFEKNITVSGRPQPNCASQPKDIQEMFEIIESFNKTVSNSFHPTFQKEKRYNGIPIRFVLVPISHFVEVKLEMLYLKIKDDLTENLEHMFITLKDITSPNFIRKQLLHKSPALKLLLHDEENKLNRDVRGKQNQLLQEGKIFLKIAIECLQSYKINKKSAQDLVTLGNEFTEKFGPTVIQETLQNFILEGNAELYGAATANSTRECQIHTSFTAQQKWLQAKSLPVKLLFSSSRNCKNASDLAQLYSIASLLNGIGIDVAVSLSTVADDGPLTTPKILIKSTSDPKEFEDVGHVVRVLSLLVDQVSEVERRFFTGYCATRGISFPLSNHSKDIIGLITILKPVKGIRIANNYIQLRECLIKSETKYSFIITMEGWNYFECVAAYNLLAVYFAEDTSVNLMVGSFELRGLHKETPLAFLFEGETLFAAADDILELKILVDGMKNNNVETIIKEFKPAKQYSLNEQKSNFQANITNLFRDQRTSAENVIDYKFKQFFPLNPAKELELAINYIAGCLIVPHNNFSLALSSLLQLLKIKDPSFHLSKEVEVEFLKADPEDINLVQHYPQILTLLSAVSPFNCAVNLAIQSIKCNGQPQTNRNERVAAIKEYINAITNHSSCPGEVADKVKNASEADPNLTEETLTFIHSILEKCTAQNEENRPNSRILSAVFSFINIAWSNPEVARKRQDIYLEHFAVTFLPDLLSNLNSTIAKKLGNNVQHHRYYEVLCDLMHLSGSNQSLYKIRVLINETFTLETNKLRHFLETILNLDSSQQQFIFQKSSVKYLLKQVLYSDTCMELLQTRLCSKSVPDFLPDFLKEKLTPDHVYGDDELVQIPENVDTVKELFDISQQLLIQDNIPSEYVRLVLNSLAKNEDIKTALSISADEYGYSEENIFSRPFTKDTLKFSLERMREHMDAQNIKPKTADDVKPSQPHKTILVNPEAHNSLNHILDQNSPGSSLPDTANLPVTCGSLTLLGSHPSIDHKRFLQVQKLLQMPRFNRNDKCDAIISQTLPYILQQLKMWGVFVLEDGFLDQMLPNLPKIGTVISGGKKFRKPGDITKLNEQAVPQPILQKSHWDSATISKLDIFSSLVHLCDPLVLQDIIRTLTFFPVAIPLIMPQLNFSCHDEARNRGFTSLKSILQEGSIKWETKSGSMVHNKLFVDSYKMIVAIRIGESSGQESGKSTILNQLFNLRDTFASKSNAASGRGPPKCLPGSAELIVLTKETCSPRLFEWKNGIDEEKPQHSIASHYSSSELAEALLLVNLHGNASTLPDHISYLKQYASVFVVFFTDAAFPKTQEEFDQISETLGGTPFYTVIINPTYENANSSDGTVYTSDLVNDSSLDGVRSCFAECINVRRMDERQVGTEENGFGKIKPIAPICSELSSKLINILETTSCGYVRGLLKLQTKRNTYGKHKDVGSLLESCGEGSEKLIEIINILIWILTLPISERKLAFAHLDKGTSSLSANQTKKQKADLVTLLQKRCSTVSLNVTKNILQENSVLEQKIRLIYQEIENNSLGLEHFYRELGKLYELAQIYPKEENNLRLISLPKSYGELMVHGYSIELLDGDNGHFHGVWVDQICHSICQISPEIRIFVVSIIGLQSSGKSTLLNALFACKFAVSVGRCTRGLFMRLLFLEDDLKEEYGVDAILLVDTEGLGAPEKMNDPDCERKDRQLATFAMSISDLTLVNVIGESVRDLTEILQIVIVTMARLDKAEMTPDILMVQHLTERDATKTLRGSEEFCNALKEAIDLTEKKDMDIGIRNSKSLTKLLHRVQNMTHLKQFRPFKNGSTVNAPPSMEYHEDVVDLYSIILKSVKAKSTQDRHRKFCNWHNLIGSYWEAVEQQDFTLRFKNIAAINEFIDRGVKITNVKKAAEKAFSFHAEKHKIMFSTKIKELEDSLKMELWGVEKENLMCIVKMDLRSIPSSCGSTNSNQSCDRCDHCLTFLTKRNELYKEVENQTCELDTKDTILKYISRTREGIIQQLDQEANARKIRSGKFSELDQLIQNCLAKSGDGGYSERKVELVLQAVKQEASLMLKVEPVKKRIMDEIRLYYENDTAVLEGLKGNRICFREFRKIEAIDPKWYQKVTNAVLCRDGTLSLHLVDELEATLGSLPLTILKERKEEIFQSGMTWNLRSKVNDILRAFEEHRLEKKKLNSNFKWEAHLYALNKYLSEMEKREKLWKRDNDPLHILENNISTYREMIKVRLENGYGSEAEGKILCKLLFEAIRKRAQQFADNHQIAFVQSQSWLSNGQQIRLKYFAALAREVNDQNKARALLHFQNPKVAINKWFKTKVNSFTKEKSIKAFKDTIATELDNVRQNLENSGNYLDMKRFADGYLNIANEMVYKPKQAPEQVDFVQLKASLLKTFLDSEKRKDLLADIALVDLSEVKSLQSLIGCTFHCPICAGICWGASGHENDSGQQAKHHTCHQPMGLAKCNYHITHVLVHGSCDMEREGNRWIHNEQSTTWGDLIALPEYRNWIYDGHVKKEFDDLMKWFFVNLHEDIASSSDGKIKPAHIPKEFLSYDFSTILSTIQAKIGLDAADLEEPDIF